jgi:hypothetical protein
MQLEFWIPVPTHNSIILFVLTIYVTWSLNQKNQFTCNKCYVHVIPQLFIKVKWTLIKLIIKLGWLRGRMLTFYLSQTFELVSQTFIWNSTLNVW